MQDWVPVFFSHEKEEMKTFGPLNDSMAQWHVTLSFILSPSLFFFLSPVF